MKINEWWKRLKESNPAEYERRRKQAGQRAQETKQAKREGTYNKEQFRERRKYSDPFSWTKRVNHSTYEWKYHDEMSKKAQEITDDELRKMTAEQLRISIQRMQIAINTRDNEIKYMLSRFAPNVDPKIFTQRDEYSFDEDTIRAELLHIYRMQIMYLRRKNTWEDIRERYASFVNRINSKAGTKYTFEEAFTKNSNFFILYSKALQMYNAGSHESKGSPIYALCIDIVSKNPEGSLDEWLAALKSAMEGRMDNEAEQDTTLADFFGLSDDDLI